MWEYMAAYVLGGLWNKGGNQDVDSWRPLNDLGAEGWELVTVTSQGDRNVAYFKRELEELEVEEVEHGID